MPAGLRASLAALAVMCVLAGCAGTPRASAQLSVAPSATPASSAPIDPTRTQAFVRAAGTPHSFEDGDDHLVVTVDNRGRDIADLAVDTGTWLGLHGGFGMGTTESCHPQPDGRFVDCGPVASGTSAAFQLRSFPTHAGEFDFTIAFFDRRPEGLVAIPSPDGTPAVTRFHESVAPLGQQIVGGAATPAPQPTP